MKRKTLRGKDVMLWLGEKVIAVSTSCKIQLAADTEDGGSKDDGMWASADVVGMKWSASNESFDCVDKSTTNDEAYNSLFDLFIAGQPVVVTIGTPTNLSDEEVPEGGWLKPAGSLSDPIYTGKANITALDRDATKGSKVKLSVSLEGVGALKKVGA